MHSKRKEIQEVKSLCKGLIKQNNTLRAKSLVSALESHKKDLAHDNSARWNNFRLRKIQTLVDFIKALKRQ